MARNLDVGIVVDPRSRAPVTILLERDLQLSRDLTLHEQMRRRPALRVLIAYLLYPATALAHDGTLVYVVWGGLVLPSAVALALVLYQLGFGRLRRWGVFCLAMLASIPASVLWAIGVIYLKVALFPESDMMPNGVLGLLVWSVVPILPPVLVAWLVRRRLAERGA